MISFIISQTGSGSITTSIQTLIQKDGVTKLPHWKHDSTLSDRKPSMPSPGDLHRSPEGPDTWAYAEHQNLESKI